MVETVSPPWIFKVPPAPFVKAPSAVRLKLAKSSVPFVMLKARVAPTVKASASCHVPPTPSNVSGRSIVCPALVIVFVPEVAAKVMAVALPAGIVMPDAKVSEPLMVAGNVGPVPV